MVVRCLRRRRSPVSPMAFMTRADAFVVDRLTPIAELGRDPPGHHRCRPRLGGRSIRAASLASATCGLPAVTPSGASSRKVNRFRSRTRHNRFTRYRRWRSAMNRQRFACSSPRRNIGRPCAGSSRSFFSSRSPAAGGVTCASNSDGATGADAGAAAGRRPRGRREPAARIQFRSVSPLIPSPRRPA